MDKYLKEAKMKPHTLEKYGKTCEDRVLNAIRNIQAGKGILLIDDESRENEGDLIFSAEKMTPRDMGLMIRHCSGIVCLCLTESYLKMLNLPPMVPSEDNTSRYGTAFSVSIEAKRGVTTGVSAHDRITTIRTAIQDHAQPEDLARPGHIFPLAAKDGGVLTRQGHTEGAVDLMQLAGLKPAAVLCELMNDDGTMSRFPEICSFAESLQTSVLSVEDIVVYRRQKMFGQQVQHVNGL